MTDDQLEPSSWIYNGIWGMLTSVFCVPRRAPVLPTMDSEAIVSRKPSPGFMTYMKFQYWLAVAIAIAALSIVTFLAFVESADYWLFILFLAIAMVLGVFFVFGYLSIYLRYDTTWYVFSDRSMRLRRGIWNIRESTITFDNIQNVKVTQGPLQRFFGIANVVVETAGGGGSTPEPGGGFNMHAGLIEGVADAAAIRDSIMGKVQIASTTGLGDEDSEPERTTQWPAKHLAVLREIRDLSNQITAS